LSVITEAIAAYNLRESFLLPKLEKSLERLVNKYYPIMTEYHVESLTELLAIAERAYNEHLNMVFCPENNGYLILIWKGNY